MSLKIPLQRDKKRLKSNADATMIYVWQFFNLLKRELPMDPSMRSQDDVDLPESEDEYWRCK